MRALLALLLLLAAFAPGLAAARPVALAPATCTGGASSAEAAFAIDTRALDCGAARFDRRERFVRAHVSLDQLRTLPDSELIWQTDPSSFTAMLIRLDYADGSERMIDVDRQMAVRNWFVNGNFWVPISQAEAPLSAIDIVVERPLAAATLERMTLSGAADALHANFQRTLAYVLVCGILLVPVIHNLLFYRVLRERFILWHIAMTAGTLLYVLFNSGLVILAWPSVGILTRFTLTLVAVSLILIGATRFSVEVLEEGSVNRKLASFTLSAAILSLLLALLVAFDIEPLRLRLMTAFDLSVVPALVGIIALLVTAIRRGSRAAMFLMTAFAGAMAAGLLQIAAVLGLVPQRPLVDDLFYAALVVLVIGSSAGVGDRFLVIKGERDRARLSAQRLGAMANSDGLTGLRNRRAFDQHRQLAPGEALLLADLDRFKFINDTFGHQRGDAVLRRAGRAIEGAVARVGDGTVYRMGGEEFAVLAPAATHAAVQKLCEDIRVAVAAASHEAELYDLPLVTISIGAAMGAGQAMHAAYAAADAALYRAKEAGRDCWAIDEG